MELVDLHTHTTASDGRMTPAMLVRHAKSKGLRAIAITDHDTVDGVSEAVEEGKKLGVEVIPGLEISVDFNPEMHILGYFPKGDFSVMAEILAELRERRELRNPKIIGKLNEMGFRIGMDEVEAYTNGGLVGRPHIAQAMVDRGYAQSIQEAFDKYLAAGRPAYFKKDKLTPEQGIIEISAAGGIPVLAHPIYLYKSMEEMDSLLGHLADAGLKGIEALYSDNTEEQTAMSLELAARHKLAVTGGSDFHGEFRPDVEIGSGRGNLEIPYELLEKLKEL